MRPASAVDWSFVKRLHHDTLREYVEPIWGWDEAEQEQFVRDWFDPSRAQIVRHGESDVGMLVVETRATEIFLESIFLVPGMQGRGLGSMMVRDVVAKAHAAGLPVRLQVLITNRGAKRLYEKLGFVVEREDTAHFKMVARLPLHG